VVFGLHIISYPKFMGHLGGRIHDRTSLKFLSLAKACFDQAFARDPEYALALLGLAEFHWQNAFYGFQYPKEALLQSKEATIRALEINDALPEAHAIPGALLGMTNCDWQAADRSFQRALQLDPNSSYVLFRYANFYLRPQGR
jgi:tetratricopeptide (TPR) repeat protein